MPAHIAEADKERARTLVAMAVREGLIDPNQPCRVCGDAQDRKRGKRGVGSHVVLHHPDYRRPLFVIPLCRPCHSRVHGGHIPDPGNPDEPARCFAWAQSPAALDLALKRSAISGHKPRGMPRDLFVREMTARGLLDAYRGRVAEHARWQAKCRAETVINRPRA